MIDYHLIRALVEAIGIGLLIGVEREKDRQPGTPGGLRSFLLFAILGALSALYGNIVLSAVTLAAVAAIMLTGLMRRNQEAAGFVTAAGALVTFWLGYLTRTHEVVAIMLAILTTSALAAKRRLHDFATKTLSEIEFYDTLKFLAIVFIIYPILPNQGYGPQGVLNPRTIWLFVILVSSISYIGYFLTKFFGVQRGMFLTAVVGGLASTTAATVAFARQAKENPQNARTLAVAAIAANTVQFPRLGAILYAINHDLALRAILPLGIATAGGALMTLVLRRERRGASGSDTQRMNVQNPFSIRPALAFGLYFAAILLITRLAVEHFGTRGIYLTSFFGGTFDVDAIAVSLAGLAGKSSISVDLAVFSLFLAAAGNAIVKLTIAASLGTRPFAIRLGLGAVAAFGLAFLLLFVRT